MPFDGCVSLCDCDGRCAGARLPAPRVKPFAGAELREPKCALNLPIVIGQTLPFPVANPSAPQSRRPNSPLPGRYGRKPGIAVFIGRHIFNRSFRTDVNARVTPSCRLMGCLLLRADVDAIALPHLMTSLARVKSGQAYFELFFVEPSQ